MFLSSILNTNQPARTNPTQDASEPKAAEKTVDTAPAQSEKTSSQKDVSQPAPAPAQAEVRNQTSSTAAVAPAQKPSEATSQSIVVARADVAPPVKEQAPSDVAFAEAAARASAEAFRATAQQIEILERTSQVAKAPQIESQTVEAKDVQSNETAVVARKSLEQQPLDKVV